MIGRHRSAVLNAEVWEFCDLKEADLMTVSRTLPQSNAHGEIVGRLEMGFPGMLGSFGIPGVSIVVCGEVPVGGQGESLKKPTGCSRREYEMTAINANEIPVRIAPPPLRLCGLLRESKQERMP